MSKNVVDEIRALTSLLPKTKAVIGYGSGAVKQAGYKEDEYRQIDVFVVVDDIEKWHKDNIAKNPEMYSYISKHFFLNSSKEKQKEGAPICYIPYIKVGHSDFKIGVIEEGDLLEDLLQWKSYYLAGRFQKQILEVNVSEEISKANAINRENALTLALLMLDNPNPTLTDVFTSLCSLSYLGDSRKALKAEDPNKVRNLVKGSYEYFQEVYGTSSKMVVDYSENVTVDYPEVFESITTLPEDIKVPLWNACQKANNLQERLEECREVITEYLAGKNSYSSKKQTIKGIKTAGPVKSIKYGISKLKKGRKK